MGGCSSQLPQSKVEIAFLSFQVFVLVDKLIGDFIQSASTYGDGNGLVNFAIFCSSPSEKIIEDFLEDCESRGIMSEIK